MLSGKGFFCPTCGREVFRDKTLSLPPHFPFCSHRCRLIDLGRWLDGEYTLSRDLEPEDLPDGEFLTPDRPPSSPEQDRRV